MPHRTSDPDHDQGRRATSTRANLAAGWHTFARLCADLGKSPLPADRDTVVKVLDFEVRRKRPSAVAALVQAVHERHLQEGHPSPVDNPVVEGWLELHRTGLFEGTENLARDATPSYPEELIRMVDALPDDLLGRRDRAMLLVARAARLSAGQAVALGVRDVEIHPDGRVDVRTKRRRKEWTVRVLPVEGGPDLAGAVTGWLGASGIEGGALFRPVNKGGAVGEGPMTPAAVGVVLKRAAGLAGLPPEAGSTELFRRP